MYSKLESSADPQVADQVYRLGCCQVIVCKTYLSHSDHVLCTLDTFCRFRNKSRHTVVSKWDIFFVITQPFLSKCSRQFTYFLCIVELPYIAELLLNQSIRGLQLPMHSVPITTAVVSSNLDQGEVYNIKVCQGFRQVGGFLRILQFPPPIKLTATI